MKIKPGTIPFHCKAIWDIILTKLRSKKEKAITQSTNITSKIKYLVESPNTESGNLKFGHLQIINTLKQIVYASSSSMTIGLFGNWGSGKSSIVENLKKELAMEKLLEKKEESLALDQNYRDFLTHAKDRLKTAQLRASIASNSELIQYYWELGTDLIEKQKAFKWGDSCTRLSH